MKYLVAWPRHGLGDRLKLVASAWAAADELQRVFVLRWLPPMGCDASWDELFKPTTGWIIGSDCYEGKDHNELLKEGLLLRLRNQEVENIPETDHKWIEVCAGYFCGRWNNKECIHPYLVKLVNPLDIIQEKINHVLDKFSEHTIGVHVRQVFGGDPHKVFDIVNRYIDEYKDGRIFFCTDTPKYNKVFSDKYKDKIIMFEQSNKNRGVEGMREALIDFSLLSRCNKIVGTKGSSFSEMSWMLSSNSTKGIFV